ncbi:guanylate kinase [Nemania serpens]|nr:guanylate kinase [Nemania serpens]
MAPDIPMTPRAEDQNRTAIESWPVVISRPSGVGKGTLAQKLFDAHPGVFASTVSHTTRAHYTLFNGYCYGTSKNTIAEQTAKGLIVLLDIEMHGVKQIKLHPGFNARYVFIKPLSIEKLEARLKRHRTKSEETELEYSKTPGVYDIIITNNKIEEAFKKLDKYILPGPTA